VIFEKDKIMYECMQRPSGYGRLCALHPDVRKRETKLPSSLAVKWGLHV
jgi:hypothetical protein